MRRNQLNLIIGSIMSIVSYVAWWHDRISTMIFLIGFFIGCILLGLGLTDYIGASK